ncbi:nitroreductase family protein [Henriciella algicola]|uniref:Nitroreductase family protein n=1 Tax=Henriciella algicola TaxID=1608422 RepID=A0A399RP51_9PROT|nr:nitroreductase family protein [Henriciella algicola]RIJ32064.1 nitroreductase family protein [Henriciella algicola]
MKTTPETHVLLEGYPEYEPGEQLQRADAIYRHLSTRRSVRDFASTPVDRAVIEACVSAAGTAPSGANHQPWYFACVGSAEKKREIRQAAEAEERAFYAGKAGEEWLDALAPIGTDAEKPYMEIAPWLICIFAQRRGGAEAGESRKNYYIHESVGIATGLLIAACHEAGLATLVHTPNPMGFLNRLCGRPDTEKPYLILVVGHPADGAMVPKHALKKKTSGEICSFL